MLWNDSVAEVYAHALLVLPASTWLRIALKIPRILFSGTDFDEAAVVRPQLVTTPVVPTNSLRTRRCAYEVIVEAYATRSV